ncbi:hypothetical protein LNV47_18115 [Paucibacter sp. DJ4R-1]|nr:hypothetical protein [Paucibacter sp. DJ4R-1]
MRLRIVAALAVLAVCTGIGWRFGADQVQDRWTAADLARERAAATLHAQQVRLQAVQADAFEAERQRLRLTLTKARHDQSAALQAPIDCAGPALRLADVPVPSAALDGLRRAGARSPAD